MAFCSPELKTISDFQLRKAQKPLQELKEISKKKVENPFNFRGVPMVTLFVRSTRRRTQKLWNFLDKVSQINVGVRLVELEHPSLKKIMSFCVGWVPVYVHPSFYQALKLKFPLDVGGVSRDGWVTTEVETGPSETCRQHPHPLRISEP